MRQASQAFKDFLAANNAFLVADLITLTVAGVAYRWTTASTDIDYDGNSYLAAGPGIKLGKARATSGAEVDTFDIELFTDGSVTIGTKALVLAAAEGALDRSTTLTVDRVYMPTLGDTSLGARRVFQGNVARVEPRSTSVRVTVKSELERLNRDLPLYVYQPACPLILYSPQCGVNKAAHTTTTTVAAGSTRTIVNVAATAPGVDSTWWAVLTSGQNAGQRRQIRLATANSVTLEVALPYTPSVGDGIEIVRGCDQRRETCLGVFNNLARFRGFADMPPKG
jgi:uncharacterized phage protein (TIGR02218 family)